MLDFRAGKFLTLNRSIIFVATRFATTFKALLAEFENDIEQILDRLMIQLRSSKLAQIFMRTWISVNTCLNQLWDNLIRMLKVLNAKTKSWFLNHPIIPPHWISYTEHKLTLSHQKWMRFKNWMINHQQNVADDAHFHWDKFKAYLLFKWQKYQPLVDKITMWSIAANTSASALRVTIQVMPIVLSIFTILGSGIPLIGFLFPEFVMTEAVLITLILGVSFLAGYIEYKKQLKRAELDAQTLEHQAEIDSLKAEVKSLKKARTVDQLHLQKLQEITEQLTILKQQIAVTHSDDNTNEMKSAGRTKLSLHTRPDLALDADDPSHSLVENGFQKPKATQYH